MPYFMPRMRGEPRRQATSSPGYTEDLKSRAYAPSSCFTTSQTSCGKGMGSGRRLQERGKQEEAVS